jgi:hypothetical protein
LFSNPTPGFLLPIAIKCNKSTPKIEVSLDFGASTSLIDKKLVQQLALMKEITLVVVEVIDG